jgi:hypothetical protein
MIKKLLLFLVITMGFTGCLSFVPEGYTPVSTTENEMIYKRYDEFKDVAFYRHKTFFGSSPIEVYIVEGTSTYPRIVFEYYGSSWIFFETATLVGSDGQRISFTFKSYDKTTDVLSGGSVKERIDIVLDEARAEQILRMISTSEEIKLRLSGKYYKDFSLPEDVVNAIKDILTMVNNM